MFAIFYAVCNGEYIQRWGIQHLAFASLWIRLGELNIFDYLKGYKHWEPIGGYAYAFIKELIRTYRFDAIVGHPIVVPLYVFSYHLFSLVYPQIKLVASAQIMMSIMSAAGVLLFYSMLRIAGKNRALSAGGASILGLSYYYRNYAQPSTEMFSIFALLLVMCAYFLYMKHNYRLIYEIMFAVMFSIALLFYITPILLLPGLLIAHIATERSLYKNIRFIVVATVVVVILANALYETLFIYIDSYYGNNIYFYRSMNFFDFILRTRMYWEYLKNPGMAGTTIESVTWVVKNLVSFVIDIPDKLVLPIGILLIYCLLWVGVVKIKKCNDKYFTVISIMFVSLLMYIVWEGIVDSKSTGVLIPFLMYGIAEGVDLHAKGYFRTIFHQRYTRAIIAVMCGAIIVTMLYDFKYPHRNNWYQYYPSRDNKIVDPAFYEQLNAKLPKNSLLVYDYSYVTGNFADMLGAFTDLLPLHYATYIEIYNHGHDRMNLFMEPFFTFISNMKGKHKLPPVYMLSSRGDVDLMCVPASGLLKIYLLFEKSCEINNKWYVYRWQEKTIDGADVFKICGKDEWLSYRNKRYTLDDLFWKELSLEGAKAIALVPTGNETIDNENYRKSKSLVYW
jgi:hypothetical protein